ncbi:MAG: metal ABC transporter permease [bacterium]|nr:metal ABC transporter permease [bacterium]
MIRAFTAGTIIAVLAPLIGTFLVARRYSLIADSLAHVSLAGVAIGLITGMYPIYTALITTIIAALFIEQLRSSKRLSGESALAIFLSGGLAVAITLIGLANGFNVNLFSYLFGSITTVQAIDVWVIASLGLVVGGTIIALYKELFFLSFDEEVAIVQGVRARVLNSILMIMTAMTVALSMRIVGALLVGALMVIPVVASMQIARSFKATVLYAVCIGFVSVWAGLFAAYYLNIPAGGAIVLSSLGILGISMILRR